MGLKAAVGLKIRAMRRQRGLTQKGLADGAQRSVEAIRSFERGTSAPSFETLERLTRVLGVPTRDFFDFGNDGGDVQTDRLQMMNTILDSVRRLDGARLELAAALIEKLAEQRGQLGDDANNSHGDFSHDLQGIAARNLCRLRMERGWTQEKLARRAGIHRRHISMIERKENAPTIDIIERLSTALDVDPVVFFQKD